MSVGKSRVTIVLQEHWTSSLPLRAASGILKIAYGMTAQFALLECEEVLASPNNRLNIFTY